MIKEKIKPVLKYAAPALPPLMLFLIFNIVKNNKAAVNVYVERFAFPLRLALGRVSSRVPFSLMELFYAVLVIWAVYYVISSLYSIIKTDRSASAVFKRLFTLLLVALYIAALYSMLFGLDYYGPSFSERSGLYSTGVLTEDLISVTRMFAERASEYSALVKRDADGSVCESLDEIFAFAENSYDGIKGEFPCLDGVIFTPKQMLFSVIMSYIGFTGVYFPFTGESNVNVHSPRAYVPSTITHEIAHQQGITSESECNFIGILAAVSSGDAAYEYSGYLSGLTYLMNALIRADTDAWREIRASFSPELEHDWTECGDYWSRMEIKLTHVTENIYDKYLKSYGQSLGIASYGACVDLLVTYFGPIANLENSNQSR